MFVVSVAKQRKVNFNFLLAFLTKERKQVFEFYGHSKKKQENASFTIL